MKLRKNKTEKNIKDDKRLKKLKREELLEMLLEQTKRAEELEAQLEQAKKALEDKQLTISEAGSIAEASLRLNNIFLSAQEAADQYLENIKGLQNRFEAENKKEA
ncbi:MAG: DNA repair protein [Clostridiales bacterium]|nr:DNA repair protein [Clostridiales bacterium]